MSLPRSCTVDGCERGKRPAFRRKRSAGQLKHVPAQNGFTGITLFHDPCRRLSLAELRRTACGSAAGDGIPKRWRFARRWRGNRERCHKTAHKKVPAPFGAGTIFKNSALRELRSAAGEAPSAASRTRMSPLAPGPMGRNRSGITTAARGERKSTHRSECSDLQQIISC